MYIGSIPVDALPVPVKPRVSHPHRDLAEVIRVPAIPPHAGGDEPVAVGGVGPERHLLVVGFELHDEAEDPDGGDEVIRPEKRDLAP